MTRKTDRPMRRLRLMLMFAGLVFLVMLAAIVIGVLVIGLLFRLGLGDRVQTPWTPLIIFAFISLSVGLVLAVFASSRPLRPLQKLMDAADRIAAGDYSVRVDIRRPEEFRSLGDKFNHMAEELGSVELLRKDFVSSFSHEFKTPIVSIRGFSKMLRLDDLTPEERNEYLDIIIAESERLAKLSDNVLSLSRLDQQVILTDLRRFDVSEQLRLVVVLLEDKWSAKHQYISLEAEDTALTANEDMIRQVWINLLDNAIKFTPDYGEITVRIRRDEASVTISVSDQGPGVSSENAAHIFDRFYQGDASHATPGNGLGLAIAKKIVELHEGSIRLAATGENGSTFEVTLPDPEGS